MQRSGGFRQQAGASAVRRHSILCRPVGTPMPATTPPLRSAWLAPVLLLLGSLFFVAIWILLALYTGRPSSWMAVIAALDAAVILRITGVRPGAARAAWAVLATLAMIVVANWGIIVVQMGVTMGLNPWDSALKLGLDHAWTLAGLANHAADLAWMGLALVVAVVAAR